MARKYDNEIKRVKDTYAAVNSHRHLHFREYLVKTLGYRGDIDRVIVDVFKSVYGVVVSVSEVMKWYAVIEDIDVQFAELVDPFSFVNRKKNQKKRKVEIIEIDSDEESCVSVANL